MSLPVSESELIIIISVFFIITFNKTILHLSVCFSHGCGRGGSSESF